VGSFFLLSHVGIVSDKFFNQNFRLLSAATNADDKTLLFEIVFVIVWLGGGIIAINGQLLGGTISFF
jgi:hypothetical protein